MAALDWSGVGHPRAGGAPPTAFLKPNLLMPRLPEQCVTTHPAVIGAAARWLADGGFDVTIGDSPGGPYTEPLLRRLYDQTGMTAAAAESGAKLNYDTDSDEHEARGVPVARRFMLCTPAVTADLLVNVCKLKTHGLTGITAAVKNLFGCIPGLHKTEYHMTQPTVDSFSEMLVDLARHLSPGLSICDAIIGMEGAGPSHGKPRRLGLLLAADDPFALDYAIALLLGVGPDGFTTLAAAQSRGYGPQTAGELELVVAEEDETVTLCGQSAAAALADMRPPRFELLAPESLASLQGRGSLRAMLRLVQPMLRSRPAFDTTICNGCGTCARSCPAKALVVRGRQPAVKLSECIRCYCCQELCPRGAVTIKRPLLSRLLYRR